MSITKVPAWQVKTTSSRGDVQKDLDYLAASAPDVVSPEMFGTPVDGDWTKSLTEAIATGKTVVSGNPGTTYNVKSPLVFPSSDAGGQVIDLRGSTILASHVGPVFCPPEPYSIPTVNNVNFKNMKIVGISGVDSRYNDVIKNSAIQLGDNSTISNVRVENIGTDAFSFNGENSRGEGLSCDNIRDNPIAMRGVSNYVRDITVGHCAGDMLLMKGSFNRVEYAIGDKCGVPGNNPEPGFIAGGIVIFGAPVDGDDLGSNNSVGFVSVKTWAALGVGFSGDDCHVGTLKLGDCYFTDDNPMVQNSKPWVSIIRGKRNTVLDLSSNSSPYGVLMLSAERCEIGTANIRGVGKINLQINTNAINCKIGTISFNTYKSLGILPNGTGVVIDNMVLDSFSAPKDSVMVRANSATTHIKSITINGTGIGSGPGCAVELSNSAILDSLVSSGFSGLSLWVRPTGKVPRLVNITNTADSSGPLAIVSAVNSCCTGWITRRMGGGTASVYQEVGTVVSSTWIGCEGSTPVAQGGASLTAPAEMNKFY